MTVLPKPCDSSHCTPKQQPHQQHYQQQQAQQQQQQQQPATESSSAAEPHATAERDDGPPPLPTGWGELRTGDGRPYYVYYPTGAVQWDRPKPPAAETEGSDHAGQPPQQQQWSPEGESAVATPGTGAAGGDGGGGEATGGRGGVDGYAEEDAARGEVRVFEVDSLLNISFVGDNLNDRFVKRLLLYLFLSTI